MEVYAVYVKTDENGYITDVNSSAFLADATGWVYIDSGSGDKYHHAQGHYFPERIWVNYGVYRYKLVDGKPVECSAEEIAEQEESRRPVPRAPRNVLAGEYVTVNGALYKAIINIPNGGRIITGQNAVETTIEAQLSELTKGE